jgi:hypothetical protein
LEYLPFVLAEPAGLPSQDACEFFVALSNPSLPKLAFWLRLRFSVREFSDELLLHPCVAGAPFVDVSA